MRRQFAHLIVLLCVTLPAAADTESHYFRVSATIEKRHVSEDGRYGVVGQALRKQQTTSADGRYALKSTTASCNPNSDILFRDGFENH